MPLKDPKANCTHPHRTQCLRHDILPFSLPDDDPVCAAHPKTEGISHSLLLCHGSDSTSPKTCQREHLNHNCWPKYLPTHLPNPCTGHKPQHQNPVPPPILAVSRQLSPPWSSEAIRDLREKPFILGLSLQAGVSKCLLSAKHHKCCKWHLFCLTEVANKLFCESKHMVYSL